jgi:hypothetical protein
MCWRRWSAWRCWRRAGPPGSSGELLARLDFHWLTKAYAADPAALGKVRAAVHVGDVRLRYETLFARLGPTFDGPHRVTDFDGLYCIVAGTAGVAVAEAPAQALMELVTDAAASWGRGGVERRAVLLALDEFSAVAGRVPVYELTERCRSLGLAVQVAAQSWQSLAPGADERARLAATAAGGVLVMRSPGPEELVSLAGTRRVIEVGRKIIGRGRYGEEGTDRVRDFGPGQGAFISGNACTYVQVAPYRRSPAGVPLAGPDGPAGPGEPVPAAPVPRGPVAGPDDDAVDDVFGGDDG